MVDGGMILSMWRIGLLESSIKVDKKLQTKLFKLNEYEGDLWYDKDYIVNCTGHLAFDEDHMEHMDYLWREDVQECLREGKAKGRALFGSLDGDNAGSFWGYEFDGKGGMKKLTGEIVWKEDE